MFILLQNLVSLLYYVIYFADITLLRNLLIHDLSENMVHYERLEALQKNYYSIINLYKTIYKHNNITITLQQIPIFII